MILNCAEFNPQEFFAGIQLVKWPRGNHGGNKRKYLDIVTAFDIETTLLDNQQSIMYIWQWQFGNDTTVIGRYWSEFIDLQKRIQAALPDDSWLVVYDFNLSFEFQFLKGIYSFVPDEVFAIASRKILKCDMWNCFEFRDAYRLTNMSLKQFTAAFHVKHLKLSGEEFDYSEKRYPWTPLTDRQLEYCVNDVWGLVEAVQALMARDGDTLFTIPLTSTGYVRRNAKRAMRNGIHHNFVKSIVPDYELYTALREAFRGGNTHANRFFSGDIVRDVHSADRSSSYPAVMCNCEYPMSIFVPILESDLNREYLERCITIRHKALLLRVGFNRIRLKDYFWGCPYLSKDKCRKLQKVSSTIDNGRILKADYLETTITDVDLKIILDEYDFDGEMIVLQGWYSSYKPLPRPLIDEVISYYRDKTALKNNAEQQIYYDKAKALLNSLYGMMAQSPVKAKQIFKQVGDFDTAITQVWEDEKTTDEEKLKLIRDIEKDLLSESNKKAFLAYQWGVWVTAHSRAALEEGIKLVHDTPGAKFVYCDTDSVKYIGSVDWSEYNKARVAECLESGAYADDAKGKRHYMGVFESEDNPETGVAYAEFKTLGAKKYAYCETVGGPTHCTIAGVNKTLGGPELDKHGGLPAFDDGFIFTEAGGTAAVYNDDPEVSQVEIDGHLLQITANVSIIPSSYTVGFNGDYLRIVMNAHSYLDNPFII